jgi:predicted nucleic acid-binding protein
MSVEFCDTNVLVYAHDVTAGPKHQQARQLVRTLWASGDGAVSIQVLQEMYVTLTRKLSPRMPPPDAREAVNALAKWRLMEPKRADILDAIDTSLRWQISLWDALIVVAARRVGATTIWSEDLSDGQDYGGIVVRNPFLTPPR